MNPNWHPRRIFNETVELGDVLSVTNVVEDYSDLVSPEWFSFALDIPARQNNISMLEYLVRNGADIHAPRDDNEPEGVVTRAAANGSAKAVSWLLDHGVKIEFNVGGEVRCRPLSDAAMGGHLDVIKVLVEKGNAPINAVWKGKTALTFAAMYGHQAVIDYLRPKGALFPEEMGVDPVFRILPVGEAEAPASPDPIVAHVESHYGPSEPLALREILPGKPAIAIHVIRTDENLILFTNGMSSNPMTVPQGQEDYRFAELLMLLPPDWPLDAKSLKQDQHGWPISWLRQVAHYPHQHQTWIGGDTFIFPNGEPPQPLGPGTKLTCLLGMISGSDSGTLARSDGTQVHFYTLFPIHTDERDLEVKEGIGNLMQQFQSHEVSTTVDPARPSIVSK